MTEPLHVLIVDDQPRARQSLKALLATWVPVGTVQEASDGLEAVRLTEELRPDLILMDVRMPGMNGLEATRLIKAKWPLIKVVVFSMYNEYRAEAAAAGAEAFVTKGELPERLLATLSAVAGACAPNDTGRA